MSTPYYNASAPVVVQGQVVTGDHLIPASTYAHSTEAQIGSNATNSSCPKGEQQPRSCRDAFWAVLFYAHIAAIAYATARYSPQMAQNFAEDYAGGAQRRSLLEFTRTLNEDDNDYELDVDANGVMTVLIISGLGGFLIATLALGLMVNFAAGLIKMALLFNIFTVGIMAIVALAAGALPMALMCGFGLLLSAYYCYVVWPKIPFAASNLATATTAVRANMGLAFLAYTNLIVSFLWSIWWAIAFMATFYVLGECDAEGNCEQEVNGGLVFLFLVSYFWTAQVVKNVVNVTVSGTVGTFWFSPELAAGCCSRGVVDSYVRSVTTSFGSICFGSLIVAIIQATREIVRSIAEDQGSGLACLAECLLGCLERLVEYFNKFAFVYVGLYGYDFMEAGKNVMSLFRARGWTSVIADVLVDTALLMVSVGVALLTGVVGVIVGSLLSLGSASLAGAFLIAALIGFVMSSTLFSLVGSAVNATIVLYAEAPAEFEANHPQLSEQMRAAWRQAYPREFAY